MTKEIMDDDLDAEIREQLGPIYDIANTVMYLESEKDKVERLGYKLSLRIRELLESIEVKNQSEDMNNRIKMAAVLIATCNLIKDKIVEEDWPIVYKNMNAYFKWYLLKDDEKE